MFWKLVKIVVCVKKAFTSILVLPHGFCFFSAAKQKVQGLFVCCTTPESFFGHFNILARQVLGLVISSLDSTICWINPYPMDRKTYKLCALDNSNESSEKLYQSFVQPAPDVDEQLLSTSMYLRGMWHSYPSLPWHTLHRPLVARWNTAHFRGQNNRFPALRTLRSFCFILQIELLQHHMNKFYIYQYHNYLPLAYHRKGTLASISVHS